MNRREQINKATKIATNIKEQHKDQSWWRGISVEWDEVEGYIINIRVGTDCKIDFPAYIDNVPTQITYLSGPPATAL